MKKLGSIAIVAMFAALTLASCKKDYTCTCTITWAGPFTGDTSFTTSGTINGKKDDAKNTCEQSNGSIPDGLGDTITTSCAIN